MTEPIDIAYVDVVVRDQDLKDLPKDVDKTMKKVEREVDGSLNNIEKRFHLATQGINGDFDKLSHEANKTFAELDRVEEKLFSHVETSVTHSRERIVGRLHELGLDFERLGGDVERKFTQRLRLGFESLQQGLSNLATNVGDLFGKIGSAVSGSPLMALIIILIPAIIALSGALVQLIGVIGLIPSALVVLVAAIAPAIVAFQNFGTAVSALASGDVKKIDEALKKLAPSAQIVAKEIAGLIDPLKALQRQVQNSFFAPLIGGFKQLDNVLIPSLVVGMSKVAIQLGNMIRRMLDFLSLSEQTTLISKVFDTTARIIARFGPSLVSLFEGFFEVATAALPIFERITNVLVDMVDRFGDFLSESARSGALTKFIEDAITTFKELGSLIGATVHLLHTMFEGTRGEGHEFLNTLTSLITQLDKFLQTAAGQDFLKELVILVKFLGASLEATLVILVASQEIFSRFINVLKLIGEAATKFVKWIGDEIPKAFHAVVDFVKQIPGLIGQFISALFDSIFIQIGLVVGLIIFSIKNLPEIIINFLESLPGRIADVLSSAGPAVGNIFEDMVNRAEKFVVDGFQRIVDFIASVPEKITELGPLLLQAGENLIKMFIFGIRKVGTFVGDVAGDIFGAIKSFLNHAIDKINFGIGKIDDILPGDLPRIPRLAQGGIVRAKPGGTLVVAGEGREDEVITPLSKLNQSSTTINFGANAISVTFTGVVPTQQEAADTGQAVGRGIIDAIKRRDIRAQVRAI